MYVVLRNKDYVTIAEQKDKFFIPVIYATRKATEKLGVEIPEKMSEEEMKVYAGAFVLLYLSKSARHAESAIRSRTGRRFLSGLGELFLQVRDAVQEELGVDRRKAIMLALKTLARGSRMMEERLEKVLQSS